MNVPCRHFNWTHDNYLASTNCPEHQLAFACCPVMEKEHRKGLNEGIKRWSWYLSNDLWTQIDSSPFVFPFSEKEEGITRGPINKTVEIRKIKPPHRVPLRFFFWRLMMGLSRLISPFCCKKCPLILYSPIYRIFLRTRYKSISQLFTSIINGNETHAIFNDQHSINILDLFIINMNGNHVIRFPFLA